MHRCDATPARLTLYAEARDVDERTVLRTRYRCAQLRQGDARARLGRTRAPGHKLAGTLVDQGEAVAVEQRARPAEDAARGDEQRARSVAPRRASSAEDKHGVVLGVGWHVEGAGPRPQHAVRGHNQGEQDQKENDHRHGHRDQKPPVAPRLSRGGAVPAAQERG